MKKYLYSAILSLLFLSSGAFAKEFHMKYYGQVINQNMHLKTGDIVAIDTYIPVNTRFYVFGSVVNPTAEALANFKFSATLGGVRPNRDAPFRDTVWTGANPGWMTYTFLGEKDIDVNFYLTP